MRYITYIILLALFSIGATSNRNTITKHAFIVAIGDYPELTGWTKISSANDIPVIKASLEKQGFTEFTILQDAEATKENIKKGLETLAGNVNAGDLVVVHFSSHGQQIMDNNRDELDGYDEAIVAYGAPAEFESGYFGEQHIRDEELGDYLNGIRKSLKENGELLVLMDACHSGTGTRGGAKARGGKKPFAPPGYTPPSNGENTDVSIYEDKPVTQEPNAKGLSPMVVISAARAHELNFEYNGNGSLSIAFARSFTNLNDKTSYRSLFSKILKEMSIIAPNQNPAIEGDVDRIVLNGRAVKQEAYFEIENVDQDAISILGGSFAGLEEGTTIKIYPSGTIETEGIEPLATGVITFSEMFRSNAILQSGLDGGASEYWMFVDQRSFSNTTMNIRIGEFSSARTKKDIEGWVNSYPLLNLRENPDFELKERNGQLVLTRVQDDEIFARGSLSDHTHKQLKNAIAAYVQGKFIKETEFANEDYSIDMELVPVRMSGSRVVDTLWNAQYKEAGGVPEFSTSDRALILLTNNSSFPVYFNIVDIQPDGQINPVVPDPRRGENASDFRLDAGQSKFIDRKYVSFGPPYGLETFKVFASYEPINFSPIFLSSKSASRGSFSNELEKLFADSYAMTRGASVGSVNADVDACTFSYTFKIIQLIK